MATAEEIEKTKSQIGDSDMEEYKNRILELMHDFHLFLKKHNLKYTLAFGTLIGAVRHNGFIPWDDDIDIILDKKEFVNLLSIVDEFNSDKYLVVKPLDDTPLANPRMLKIYDKTVCAKEFGVECYDGPFIDVFSTIDLVDEGNYKKEADKLRLYTTLLMFKNKRITTKSHLGRNSFVLSLLSKFYSKKNLKRKIKDYYDRDTSSKRFISSFGSRITCEYAWLKETAPHKFEQYEFDISKDYDLILQSEYGDYMELPPVEKRNPHHVQYLSFSESFLEKNNKVENHKQ